MSSSTAYSYTVSAIDAAGNESSQSSSAGATTGSGGTVTAFASNVYGDLTTSVTATGATSTMAYDLAGRLRSIAAGGSTTSLLPDALGRIRSRTVGAVTDTYGYLGPSETIVSIGGGSSTRASVLGADGSRVATKDGSTLGYLVPDLHGNVAAIMAGGSGTLVNALRYDGYGQTIGSPYAAASGQLANVDARYQGRLDLAPTGDPVYEFSAREYAPALGSFTSLDSVMGSAMNPVSMNRFLYAEANPTTLIDPTGHGADCSYQDKCSRDQWQKEIERKREHEKREKKARESHPDKPSGSSGGSYGPAGGGTPPKSTPTPQSPDERDGTGMSTFAIDPSDDILGGIGQGLCNATFCGIQNTIDSLLKDPVYTAGCVIINSPCWTDSVITNSDILAHGTNNERAEVVSTLSFSLVFAFVAGRASAGRSQASLVSDAAIAGEASDHIVLGLSRYGLRQTAAKFGGRHLMDDRDFRRTLISGARNPSTRFTVSLDGFRGEGTYNQVMRAVADGNSKSPSGFANWELAKLHQFGRLRDVTFVRNGEVVDNPFAGGG